MSSVRILYIEDNAEVRWIIGKMLQTLFPGVEVIAVESNEQAFVEIARAHPDIIISENNPPGGSGLELLAALRAEHATRRIPVMIVTAWPHDSMELDSYRAGADRFLRKPVSMAVLKREIGYLLDRFGIKSVDISEDEDLFYLRLGVEEMELDYKREINFDDKISVASLAKDVIAMANSGGGRIIIGVDEVQGGTFEWCGVPENCLSLYEVTKLNDRLKRYTGEVCVKVRFITESDKRFVVIKIDPVTDTIAFPKCDHQGASLFEGRIYIRRQDARTAELRDSLEAARLVRRLIASVKNPQ